MAAGSAGSRSTSGGQGADPVELRRLLNRRELAAARHRAAIARQLGLGDAEMLAVAHLAQRGALAPGELGALLGLSSGGVSALVQRLEHAGDVLRAAHPSDGRRSLLRLSPALVRRAERALGPLVADVEALAAQLDEDERRLVTRFLARLAALTEHHAERAQRRLARDAAPAAPGTPSLWG